MQHLESMVHRDSELQPLNQEKYIVSAKCIGAIHMNEYL